MPWRGIVIYTICALLAAWIILPFSWIVISSLMHEVDVIAVPPAIHPGRLTLDNYLAFFNPRMMAQAHLLDSLGALVLTYTTFTVPYSVWILQNYFRTIPHELDDAARVDGCNWGNMMLRVLLPVAAPGLVVVALFSFLSAWGEFLFALVLTTSMNSKTMPIIVSQFVTDINTSPVLLSASGVLAVIPPLVLALVFQKLIVTGIAAGAVKS